METPPELINVAPGRDADPKPSAVHGDPYQDKVVNILVDILRQQTHSSHHHLVVESLISIAKTRGVKFGITVPKVYDYFFSVFRWLMGVLDNSYNLYNHSKLFF